MSEPESQTNWGPGSFWLRVFLYATIFGLFTSFPCLGVIVYDVIHGSVDWTTFALLPIAALYMAMGAFPVLVCGLVLRILLGITDRFRS
jgi:hypothetical protein